jgi:hypothetical protein
MRKEKGSQMKHMKRKADEPQDSKHGNTGNKEERKEGKQEKKKREGEEKMKEGYR